MSHFIPHLSHRFFLFLHLLLLLLGSKLTAQHIPDSLNEKLKEDVEYLHLKMQDSILENGILKKKIQDSIAVFKDPKNDKLDSLKNFLGLPEPHKGGDFREQVNQYYEDKSQGFTGENLQQKIKEQHIKLRDSLFEHSNNVKKLETKHEEFQKNKKNYEGKVDSMKSLLTLPLGSEDETAQQLNQSFQGDLQQMQKLPLLQGAKFKDSIYSKVEEAKNSLLSENDYKLKESQVNEVYKEVVIKEKTSFKDRAYFEGLIGFNDLDFNLLQVAPAMGLQITKSFSLGLGLDGLFKRGLPDLGTKKEAILGLKTFVKWEAWKDKFYLQAENSSYFSELSYLTENLESKKESLQVPYIGGGYLLDVSENKQLNISLMHRLRDHPFFTEGDSSWLLRLGLSIYPHPLK